MPKTIYRVLAGQTQLVPAGYLGDPEVVLIMDDNSTLRFDPNIAPSWTIKFDSAQIGNNVAFDLSGHDAITVPPPTPPQPSTAGHRNNGTVGPDGAPGSQGGPTAELELSLGSLTIDTLVIKRHAGNGQPGGNGATGGDGGSGDIFGRGGDGGFGGYGGRGGNGGDVLPVTITYSDYHHGGATHPQNPGGALPGITDDSVPGKGAQPGTGGVGGQGGSGPQGGGQSHPSRGDYGPGSDGRVSALTLLRRH